MIGTIYIIHGCPDTEDENGGVQACDTHWIPWVKAQLEGRGYKVLTPLMPKPWAPDYKVFKAEFEKNEISENDVFIGHSCGGSFFVRWLGESKQKVAKLILVAPWKIPDPGDEARENYYSYTIDKTIPERVGEIVMFTSDNEEADGKESVKIFHEALGGRLIELSGRGHYVLEDMGTEEFPELLTEIA